MSIIVANKALTVSVMFNNDANDVTFIYNYTLTLHYKFGELKVDCLMTYSKTWPGFTFGLNLA